MWFGYTPDRKGEHPQAHLSNFTGTLKADGYAGFDQAYETGRIQEAACWAHVRRKFYDLVVAHKSQTAAEARGRIGAVYAIEKEIRGFVPEQRRKICNERSRPLTASDEFGFSEPVPVLQMSDNGVRDLSVVSQQNCRVEPGSKGKYACHHCVEVE